MAPCSEQDTGIPRVTFNFIEGLDKLTPEHKDNIVDIIAICRSAGDAVTFTSNRTGKEFLKRELMIVDQRWV